MQQWMRELLRTRGRILLNTTVGAMLAELDPRDRAIVSDYVSDLEAPVARLLMSDRQFQRAVSGGSQATGRALQAAIVRWASAVPDAESASVAQVRALASEFGVADLLEAPVSVLAHEAQHRSLWRLGTRGSIAELAAAEELNSGELALIRSYFAAVAEERAGSAEREARWAAPCASPPLEEASTRFKALLAGLPAHTAFVIGKSLRFEVNHDQAALLVEDARGRFTSRLALPFASEPSKAAGWDPSSALAKVLLETALDAIHDPSHRSHRELRRALETPVWERMLERVKAQVTIAAKDERPSRVAWRIRTVGKSFHVEALVQTQKGNGWSKGRVEAIEKLRRKATLADDDERVLRAAQGPPYSGYEMTWDRRAHMLVALAGHPRVLVDGAPGSVRVARPEIVVREDGGELELVLRVGDELVPPAEAHARITKDHYVEIRVTQVIVAPLDPATIALVNAAATFTGRVPASASDALLAVLAGLPSGVGLELPPSIAGAEAVAVATPVLRLEPLHGGRLRASVFVRPFGFGPMQRPGDGPIHMVAAHDGARVHTTRDLEAERAAAERLVAAGLDRAESRERHEYLFDDGEPALDLIDRIAREPELAFVEWPRPESKWRTSSAGAITLGLRRAEHWFAASAKLAASERDVALAPLMQAFRSGRRYVVLGPGNFARITDELRAQLGALDAVAHVRGSHVEVAPSAALYLDAAIEVHGDAAWTRLRDRARGASALEPVVPDLRAELRDYQIEGVRWLLRTSTWAEGACLADEMGLGKTVQTLALLAARASLGPALVVCPTSVADNWAAECRRFAPSLDPVVHRGAGRAAKLRQAKPGTVLIASYDVVGRDRDELAALDLATLVLDEAQAIKNPQAQRTKAVHALSAEFRVALTGTPLENRLSELHSIFSAVTPGLLGSPESFRQRFALPIEKHGDRARLDVLRSLLRPFLLRRTKAAVARELPPRIDTVREVELGPEESALYEAERRRVLSRLEEQRAKGRNGIRSEERFELLAALTRLRRIACHPSLVFEGSTAPSSKLEELSSLLDDLRAEGHRALVFSQFTSFLAIVRRRLSDRAIEHLYLDGSTPAAERAVLVRRWQEGSAPVFLISLKAGGLGLNLTAADYVVHLDPWWNPAVEDQASDRAHRIGQDKPVTVVRLVAQGTIEERVLELHADKRALAEGVLEGGETSAALDTEDLLALLEVGSKEQTAL
jgi:superfamily II DNA or RNA helicase